MKRSSSSQLEDRQWIAQCAERLREQWPRADPTSLEDAARDLSADEALRCLAAREAAERWLGPLQARSATTSEGEIPSGPRQASPWPLAAQRSDGRR